jgi:hypothetical protein
MEEKDYIHQIYDLSVEQIVEGISNGKVTFNILRKTGDFGSEKQRLVKVLLKKKDDEAFAEANTIISLKNYLLIFPEGNHIIEARNKIQKKQDEEIAEEKRRTERAEMLRKIKEDINEYTPDEIIQKLSNEDFDDLCIEMGIDAQMIKNYTEPTLKFNDIPSSESEIPLGYTDVFFWGIPSSGKTCALSAILNTIKKDHSMEAPDCEKKFGATYRTSLVNIFQNEYGYLPGRTNEDRTQYMPFLFYKRGEKNKRKISFFELSGEVFKYFYEKVNNTQIIDDYGRENIEKSFQTLELLLNSNNQKIHFFFIDYNQETKHTLDSNRLSQGDYLEAAAVYFRDNNGIFKKKTDAVYVVITKSDEIPGNDPIPIAKSFLEDNFGNFMSVLKNQCNNYSVDFNVKLFSIGDVYFKKICKINRAHSTAIITDLLQRIKPIRNSIIRNFFNS